MVQKQSQETPFLFSLQEEGKGQRREMGICKDGLLHLHRIKKTFTSVGSGSGAPTSASSGTPAAPSLFFLGLSLDVRRMKGSWDFAPPWRARRGRGRAAQGLRVWKSIQADCLLCVYCWPMGSHARPSRCFQLGSHKQSMLPSLPRGLLCLSPPRPPGRVAKAPV